MKLISLKNPQAHVQIKMTFFLEYFLFANEFLGRFPFLPFDTPGSIINKIRHQLRYNHQNRCIHYLDSYIEALALHFGNLLDKSQDPYRALLADFFKPFTQLTKSAKTASTPKARNKIFTQQIKLIEDNKSHFIQLLEQFEKDYAFDDIEGHVDAIYQLICCNEPSHDHFEELAQRAQLIVTGFRFRGVSKGSIDDFVDRILSKDKSRFPLPPHILDQKSDKEEFENLSTDFLLKRDFKAQLDGFKNLLHVDKFNAGTYIFFLENIDLLPEHLKKLNATFRNVRIIWSGHEAVNKIKSLTKDFSDRYGDSAHEEFFNEKKVLALIEQKFDMPKSGELLARKQVEEAVEEFNNYIGYRSIVNEKHRLLVKSLDGDDFDHNMTIPRAYNVVDEDIENVNQNAYNALRHSISDTADLFRNNERVFAKAWKENDPAEFWQYLENLFWDTKNVNTEIKEKFVSLCLSAHIRIWIEIILRTGLLFRRDFHNDPADELQISQELVNEMFKSLYKNKQVDFDFTKSSQLLQRPFLNKLFSVIEQYRNPASKEEWAIHFKHLINEMKDFRNAWVHAGNVNSYSKIKLETIVKPIINEVRWYLLEHCKNHPHLNISDFWMSLGIKV